MTARRPDQLLDDRARRWTSGGARDVHARRPNPGTPETADSASIPGPLSPAEQGDYSPAVAAFALLLTTGVLAGLVLAVWTLGGL